MRSFVAIPLPEALLWQLETLQAEIPVGRVTPAENLHLTLSFLGEMTEAELREVHTALSAIRHETIPIEVVGLDLFGGRLPQILFAAIRADQRLLALQAKLVRAVRTSGIALRRERFRPHVTLARFNRPPQGAEAERLAEFLQWHGAVRSEPFPVESFALFRSDLGHGPARHTELARYPLAG